LKRRRTWNFQSTALIHEIGHAVGLIHEHQRPDRNQFVTVNNPSIIPSQLSNFPIVPNELLVGAYDCTSIMHYPAGAFQIPNPPGAVPSIQPSLLSACNIGTMGQSAALTAQDIATVAFMYGRFTQAGAGVALANQTADVMTALAVDATGALTAIWVEGTDAWEGPARISGPTVAPVGAGIALCKQTDDTLTALVVDQSNRLNLLWVDGNGPWQGPIPFGPPNFDRSARIALCKQTDDILTALVVDATGRLNVTWVEGTGQWQGPIAFGPATFPAIAPIALCKQTEDILTAVLIDNTNSFNIAWVSETGTWNGPVPVYGV
jgi:hypothetical protein